jgi:hypothetical protein
VAATRFLAKSGGRRAAALVSASSRSSDRGADPGLSRVGHASAAFPTIACEEEKNVASAPVLRVRIRIQIRIHIFLGLLDPDPDPSIILLSLSKYNQKNLDFYCFVTSFWLFIFEKLCKSIFKKQYAGKLFFKYLFFVGILKVNDENRRIRICIRIKIRIRIH